MSGKYYKILLFWTAIFAVSSAIVFISWNRVDSAYDGRPPSITDPDEGEPENGQNLSIVLGVVSALISASGFIVTTYFALREDRRDNTMHNLQIKKLQREIEEKELELDRLRKQAPPP